MSARTLAPFVAPLVRAGVRHYFLRREERLEEKRADARREALESVELTAPQESTREPPAQPSRPPEPEPEPAPPSPTSRLDEFIEREDCGICRQALEQLKSRSEAQREAGLDVYENLYKPTRDAYEAGDASEEELEAATDKLLEAAGV